MCGAGAGVGNRNYRPWGQMAEATMIRCPGCGVCLGLHAGGHYVSHHRGRKVVAERAVAIRCERCGTVWRKAAIEGEHDTVPVHDVGLDGPRLML